MTLLFLMNKKGGLRFERRQHDSLKNKRTPDY